MARPRGETRGRKQQLLRPEEKSSGVCHFEEELSRRVIGQPEVVDQLVMAYQTWRAGLNPVGRPIATLLFMGPTGVGKTRAVEAAAEILFGNPKAFLKIDCAEYQHSHEIARLIGSPAGYLGHRETPPILTQEALKEHQTESDPFSFVLFDEAEKADEALWQLLLGVLDKGTLTLGDTRKTDFTDTIVVLTTNVGAREIETLADGDPMGFTAGRLRDMDGSKLQKTAMNAVKRKFTPEFMNRIDRYVVFRRLDRSDFMQILKLELEAVQMRIVHSSKAPQFILLCTEDAAERLIDEGTDVRYGARELKRALERLVVIPLANLVSTGQIVLGDIITVDLDDGEIVFLKEPAKLG